jgi:GTPase SAR1 family protein
MLDKILSTEDTHFKRILLAGIPGSGKTFLTNKIVQQIIDDDKDLKGICIISPSYDQETYRDILDSSLNLSIETNITKTQISRIKKMKHTLFIMDDLGDRELQMLNDLIKMSRPNKNHCITLCHGITGVIKYSALSNYNIYILFKLRSLHFFNSYFSKIYPKYNINDITEFYTEMTNNKHAYIVLNMEAQKPILDIIGVYEDETIEIPDFQTPNIMMMKKKSMS